MVQCQNPRLQPFLVKNIFTDFKRHDLETNLHERHYDGTTRTHFLTTPLWGVGSKLPYKHDGRRHVLYLRPFYKKRNRPFLI